MSRQDDFERRWNLRQIQAGVLEGDVLAELVRLGTRVIQDSEDLKIDGLAGPDTRQAIEDALGIMPKVIKPPRKSTRRPPPDLIPIPTRRNVEAVYGTFAYASDPARPGAIVIEKKWVRDNIVKVHFGPGGKQYTWMHRHLAVEFPKLLAQASEFSGYYPKRIWSWVPRHKSWNPKNTLSLHSWGAAVDFDSRENSPNTPKELTLMAKHPAFLEVFRAAGWTCGMDWGGYGKHGHDAMHVERVRR